MKTLYLLSFILIVISCDKARDSIPNVKINYIDKYHCWPYDVKVYSVENIKLDSLFYTYPKQSYFRNPKYKSTTWKLYANIDTTKFNGMKGTLKKCDNNIFLYNQLSKKNKVFYSGNYRYFGRLNGTKKQVFDEILFLDIENNQLHVFKDVNKAF